MLRIRLRRDGAGAESLEPAVSTLRSGGIVAFPTETFYGLAVDPRSSLAVQKIFTLKRRMPNRPLPLIAASIEQVQDHVGTMTPLAQRLAARAWPGPLTLIIPASPALCEEIHLGTGKVAVRVPGDPVARQLAASAAHAITSTSANLSGEPPASTPDQVAIIMGDEIDVLIDVGPTPAGLPSTIVDVTRDKPELVRAGVIAWDHVLEFLHS
jgi:L-threonylcarbamoyladenylate synthase